jgi:hypothetical protein
MPVTFIGKFWLYAIERSEGAHLFFEFPFIEHLSRLGSDNPHTARWVHNNMDQWETIGMRFEFQQGHVHRGSQGAQVRSNVRDMPLVGSELALFTAEPIGSAVGVTIAICHYCVPINSRYVGEGDQNRGLQAHLGITA